MDGEGERVKPETEEKKWRDGKRTAGAGWRCLYAEPA